MTRIIPGLGVLEVLNAAWVGIGEHITNLGDGLLPGPDGRFMWLGSNGITLLTENANNHQTT